MKSWIESVVRHSGLPNRAWGAIVGCLLFLPAPLAWSGGTLEVFSPTSGHQWQSGATASIQWNKGNAGRHVRIELRKAGKIVRVIRSRAYNTGNYRWRVPQSMRPGRYTLKIFSLRDRSVSTVSGEFEIVARTKPDGKSDEHQPQINSPVGGEILVKNTRYLIEWDDVADTLGVHIEIHLQRGATRVAVLDDNVVNSGRYLWAAPAQQLPTGQGYRIKLQSKSDKDQFVLSGGFAIATSQPEQANTYKVSVMLPTNRQTWGKGRSYNIRWLDRRKTAGSEVRIELYRSGKYYQTIAQRAANKGRYQWKVPHTLVTGANYQIRVTSLNNANISGSSTGHFTVSGRPTGRLYVVSPVTDQEVWQAGQLQTIKWKKGGGGRTVRIDLYQSDRLYKTLSRSTRNDGTHRLKVPSTVATGSNYAIRIQSEDPGRSRVYDLSDKTFAIHNAKVPPMLEPGLNQATQRSQLADDVSTGMAHQPQQTTSLADTTTPGSQQSGLSSSVSDRPSLEEQPRRDRSPIKFDGRTLRSPFLPPEGRTLLDRASVLAKVRNDILPNLLAREVRKPILQPWPASTKALDTVLVWTYLEALDVFRPTHYLISIVDKGAKIALMTVDPYTGEFLRRTLKINSGRLSQRLKGITSRAEVTKRLLDGLKPEDKHSSYIEDAEVVSINGHHYWIAPTKDKRHSREMTVLRTDTNERMLLKEALAFNAALGDVLAKFRDKDGRIKMSSMDFLESQLKLALDNLFPIRIARATDLFDKDTPEDIKAEEYSLTGALGKNIGTLSTRMVGEVPLYHQKTTSNCWAYSLAMVHQWWTPIDLGGGDEQTDMLRHYLGKTKSQGADLKSQKKVMKNWPTVLSNWKSKNGVNAGDFPYEYEEFDYVKLHQGKAFNAADAPAGNTEDPKTWIVGLENPVLASVDSDAGGSDSHVDHMVVIVGYDDALEEVYVNNPWGHIDAFSYKGWAMWWHAIWETYATANLFDGFHNHSRRGMIAGLPGSFVPILSPNPKASANVDSSDNIDSWRISKIKMNFDTPLSAWDKENSSCVGPDSYGDSYDPLCTVVSPGLEAGIFSKGSWSAHTQNNPPYVDSTLTWSQSIPQQSTIPNTAGDYQYFKEPEAVHVEPMMTEITCRIYACKTRTHFQGSDTVVLNSDNWEVEQEDGTSFWIQVMVNHPMPKPGRFYRESKKTLAVYKDSDGDGINDSVDLCPTDYGVTWGDQSDTKDSDNDGVGDSCDVCPGSPDNKNADNDSYPDNCDNCPEVAQYNQSDLDQDGVGDLCDDDTDGDGLSDKYDNCPNVAEASQTDSDGDGFGDVCDKCEGHNDKDNIDQDYWPDACDNCPLTGSYSQIDSDQDGLGDACDSDDDNDGIADSEDNCPVVPNPDQATNQVWVQGQFYSIPVDCEGDYQKWLMTLMLPDIMEMMKAFREGPRGPLPVDPWLMRGPYVSPVLDYLAQINEVQLNRLISEAGERNIQTETFSMLKNYAIQQQLARNHEAQQFERASNRD